MRPAGNWAQTASAPGRRDSGIGRHCVRWHRVDGSRRGRRARAVVDQCAVGGDQPPHATDALTVEVARSRVLGEVVQRPTAERHLLALGMVDTGEQFRIGIVREERHCPIFDDQRRPCFRAVVDARRLAVDVLRERVQSAALAVDEDLAELLGLGDLHERGRRGIRTGRLGAGGSRFGRRRCSRSRPGRGRLVVAGIVGQSLAPMPAVESLLRVHGPEAKADNAHA